MSVLATDNFDRTNNTTLGANWTLTSGGGAFHILTNRAANGSNDLVTLMSYTGVSAPANQYAQCVISDASANSDQGMGPAVRVATGATTAYFAQPNTSEIKLYKVVTDTFTQLGSDAAAVANGNTVYIEANGTSITAKKNGSTIVGPITDSGIASGNFGLWSYTNEGVEADAVDDWEGGDFSAGGGSTPSTASMTMLGVQ